MTKLYKLFYRQNYILNKYEGRFKRTLKTNVLTSFKSHLSNYDTISVKDMIRFENLSENI